MLSIREEIRAIENGDMDRDDNPLRNAAHHAENRQRRMAPFLPPLAGSMAHPRLRQSKFWPAVGRITYVTKHGLQLSSMVITANQKTDPRTACFLPDTDEMIWARVMDHDDHGADFGG